MLDLVSVPVWLLSVLAILATAAVYHYVLAPLARSTMRQRSSRVVRVVNPRLQFKLPAFALTRRRVLADRLSHDPVVVAAVEAAAAERGAPVDAVRREVAKIAYDMVPSFSPYFYFRFGHRIARAFMRFMYRVRLGEADDAGIAAVSAESSIVFVMNHRTNLDYALVTYLTAKRTMWTIGAGEWARAWPLRPLLRAAGVYFLRRETNDALYRAVLKRFIQMVTEARVPHAMFLEGALSRTGGLHPPKLGLLSYLTTTFDPQTSPDITFIPIGINYDRVAEERTIVAHASESFVDRSSWFVLRSVMGFIGYLVGHRLRGRRQPFGNACANFGTPVSFSAWLRNHWVDWASLDRDGRFYWLKRLGDELMSDIEALIPGLPLAFVCSVVRGYGGESFKEADLRGGYDTTIDAAQEAGCRICLPEGDRWLGYGEALRMLRGRHILQEGKDGRFRSNPRHQALIDYYATSVAQFVPDARNRRSAERAG
jgi:glycerol-3-phosphate O-acyltransferase